MSGGGTAKIRGCGEREEETSTCSAQELNCGGDEALTFGGVQGAKERKV